MNEAPGAGLTKEDFLGSDGNLDYGQVLLFVQALLQELDPDLLVDPSLDFIITEDYPSALAELSKSVGRDLRPTHSDGAEGVAMTVNAGDHDVIVLHAGVLEALFTPGMALFIHTIHHELGHAHDHMVRRQSEFKGLPTEGMSDLRLRMFPLAEGLWGEYHAERHSAGTIQGQSIHVPQLMKFMPHLLNEVAGDIAQYRHHWDVPKLMGQVSTRLDLFLTLTGYVLGDMAGTGSDPTALHPDLLAFLAKPPMQDLWQPLQQALDQFYVTHGHWESSVVFIPLEKLLVKVFHELGLDLSEHPRGLFVGVPYR